MGVIARDYVEIADLTTTSNTSGDLGDGPTGTWNTGVDLDAIDPDGVPAGASGVIIRLRTNGGDNVFAVREAGSSTTFGWCIGSHDELWHFVCPLVDGTLDIYQERDVNWYVVGYTDDAWTFLDPAGGFPHAQDVSGGEGERWGPPSGVSGALALVIPPGPADASYRWAPVEGFDLATINRGGIIPLNEDGEFWGMPTGGYDNIEVCAYITSGVELVFGTTIDSNPTFDSSTWTLAEASHSDAAMALVEHVIELNEGLGFRPAGASATPTDVFSSGTDDAGSGWGMVNLVPLSSGGEFEYIGDPDGPDQWAVQAWLLSGTETEDLVITAEPENAVRGGSFQVSVAQADSGNFTATLAGESLTVDSTTDEGDGDWQITLSVPNGLAAQHGDRALVIGDGATTDSTNIDLVPPDGYAYTDLAAPIVAAPQWQSGNSYSTGDEVYWAGEILSRDSDIASSTTEPADGVDGWSFERLPGSALDGYTGDAPVADDQVVYTTEDGSYTFDVESDGNWIISPPPSRDVQITAYVIDDAGEIGQSATITYSPQDVDTTPNPFSFAGKTAAALESTVASDVETISGLGADAPISVTGGEYAMDFGAGFGSWRTSASEIPNGAEVKVRVNTDDVFGSDTTAELTVGGETGSFTVTNPAEDTAPNSFTFPSQSGVETDDLVESASITVQGINSDAPISVQSDHEAYYSVNGAALADAPGTVAEGDTVAVFLRSSGSNQSERNLTLDIGGVTATFSITTRRGDDADVQPIESVPVADYTAATMIRDALRKINVPGRGAELAAEDLDSGFETLQLLVGSEGVGRGLSGSQRKHFFALPTDQVDFTYGTDGSADLRADHFGDPAPYHIVDAYIRPGATITDNEHMDQHQFEAPGDWTLGGVAQIQNDACYIMGEGSVAQDVNLTEGLTYELLCDVQVVSGTAYLEIQSAGVVVVSLEIESSGRHAFAFEYEGNGTSVSLATRDPDSDVRTTMLSIKERNKPRLEVSEPSGGDFNVKVRDLVSFNKLARHASGRPRNLLYQRTLPLPTLQLDAPGQTGDVLVLDVNVNRAQVQSLQAPFWLEGAARLYMTIRLAEALAPEYGKELSASQIKIMDDAFSAMYAQNHDPGIARVDHGLRTNRTGYNIDSDD